MVDQDKPEFCKQMAKCATATRSEISDLDVETHWEQFRHLTIEDYSAAMLKASRELDKFPTVFQVRGRIPRRKSLHDQGMERIERRRESGSIADVLNIPVKNEVGSKDIEERLKALSDEDVHYIFASQSRFSGEQKSRAGDFGLKMFQRGNIMYRNVVRWWLQDNPT